MGGKKGVANTLAGPKGYPLVGVLPLLRRDPFGFLNHIAQEYGDAAAMKLGPRPCFVLNHPDHVNHVLVSRPDNYVKSHLIDKLKPVLGNGLLTSDGALWKRQRQTLQPRFTPSSITPLAGMMRRAAIAKLDQVRHRLRMQSGPIDASALLSELTLDILVRTMFSTDISDDLAPFGEAVIILQRDIADRMWAATDLGQWLPTKKRRQARQALALVDRVVDKVISERRQARGKGYPATGDLMDLLLDAMNEGGQLDERQLRDEVVTIFGAGNETTANALSWVLALLGEHPWAAEKCRQELAQGQDTYLRLVIQESLRLRPPIWWFAREALQADTICGLNIPAKAVVIISQHLLHRHPGFWDNPDQFDPERFTPERSAGRHRFAYFPFGAGPRNCIGGHMAMTEMVIIVEEILRRFSISLVDHRPPEPEAFVTLRPKGGLWMHWQDAA